MASLECMTYIADHTWYCLWSAGKLLLAFCLCCMKYHNLSHNSEPQHDVSLCIVHVMRPFQPFVFNQRQNSYGFVYKHYCFDMSCLELSAY